MFGLDLRPSALRSTQSQAFIVHIIHDGISPGTHEHIPSDISRMFNCEACGDELLNELLFTLDSLDLSARARFASPRPRVGTSNGADIGRKPVLITWSILRID
jgi:hypothetical protein